jgi:hypothetical protein
MNGGAAKDVPAAMMFFVVVFPSPQTANYSICSLVRVVVCLCVVLVLAPSAPPQYNTTIRKISIYKRRRLLHIMYL